MDLIFILTSVALGVGLAMDAFSVSVANGIAEPTITNKKALLIATVFAVFQAVMPIIGWLTICFFVNSFGLISEMIPFVAFILLLMIGIKMLVGGIKNKPTLNTTGINKLIIQGVATSVDALSVGLTLSTGGIIFAIVRAVIIGVETFIICFSGVYVGKKFGIKYTGKATVLGGIILLAVSLEILVKGIINII